MADDLDVEFGGDQWLRQKGRVLSSGVKIHQDVRVIEGTHKAAGGLVRAIARIRGEHIDDAEFSGDFAMLPSDGVRAIEASVAGVPLDERSLEKVIGGVYSDLELESPGVYASDFVAALVEAAAR